MTYKKERVLLLIIILFGISGSLVQSAAPSGNTPKKVLLLYDRRNYFGYKSDEITSISELMGHFEVKVDELEASSYKKGLMEGYDFIFYIGIEKEPQNTELLADFAVTDKTVCIMGKGLRTWLESTGQSFADYGGETLEPLHVSYGQKSFSLGTKRLFQVADIKDKAVKVYSTLSDGYNTMPYIFSCGKLWYVSRLETDGVLFYIFADILHDIFGEYHTAKPRIYVRIEDVHVFREPEKLRAIADFLQKEKVPFMIALIPAYRDADTGDIHTISEKRAFVEAVKYMQSKGGSIVLHGYTHQAAADITAEGFEFWDEERDKPPEGNAAELVRQKVGQGLSVAADNGIYPLLFEFPHYAASRQCYLELRKYFSTVIGQIQTSDTGFTTTIYPYKLHNTELFEHFIPENLGFIESENPRAVQELTDNLEQLSVVRDYTAGFFFHPYLDISYLEKTIGELKAGNVEFYDVRQENNRVKYGNYSIKTVKGRLIKSVPAKAVEEESKGFFKLFEHFTLGLALLVALVCASFLIILLISRRRSRRNLFKE